MGVSTQCNIITQMRLRNVRPSSHMIVDSTMHHCKQPSNEPKPGTGSPAQSSRRSPLPKPPLTG
jgi:hypothetical protein